MELPPTTIRIYSNQLELDIQSIYIYIVTEFGFNQLKFEILTYFTKKTKTVETLEIDVDLAGLSKFSMARHLQMKQGEHPLFFANSIERFQKASSPMSISIQIIASCTCSLGIPGFLSQKKWNVWWKCCQLPKIPTISHPNLFV